jgi:ABC-type uncharacterized transport system ATPase subunit
MVFQHFSLFEALNVAENVALGMETRRRCASLPPDPVGFRGIWPAARSRPDGGRSVGRRAPAGRDHPLPAAGSETADHGRADLGADAARGGDPVPHPAAVAGEGTSILYISHKLEEIRALCDEATILRRGKVVGTCTPRERTAREMAELMVGATLGTPHAAPGPRARWRWGSRPVGRLAHRLRHPSEGVSFTVAARARCWASPAWLGNGQDELLLALSGELRAPGDRVRLNDHAIGDLGPNGTPARRAGDRARGPLRPCRRPGHEPDGKRAADRGDAQGLTRNGFIDWAKTRAFAEEIIADYDVRTPGPGTAARALSGGNLQKFVMGRELLQDADVIVINQPTWGVDAAAAASIRQASWTAPPRARRWW